MNEVFERCRGVIDWLKRSMFPPFGAHNHVAIVSHGKLLSSLISIMLGLPYSGTEKSGPNTCVTVVDFNLATQEFAMVVENDNSHLTDPVLRDAPASKL